MIELRSYDLARIESVRRDPSQLDGIAVVEGALPPAFLLDDAIVALRAGKPALWHSPWAFVDRDTNRVVGSGTFKGAPENGWVEIGYGIAESCQRKGHATAAVFALVKLAFEQPGLLGVYAESSIVNGASKRVLQKIGFAHSGQRLSEEDGLVDCWYVNVH